MHDTHCNGKDGKGVCTKMKRNENICKFVTHTSDDQIITTNFVYEGEAKTGTQFITDSKYKIGLVIGGTGVLHTEHQVFPLSTKMLFFTFAEKPYRIENTGELQYIFITFYGGRAEELLRRFAITPMRCTFEGHEGLVSFWENGLAKAGEQNLDLISESVLLYTFSDLALILPAADTQTSLVGEIVQYLDANFTDRELTLETTAAALGYSAKYISRVFKQSMGLSFSEYVKNARIQHAVFLMEQGITAVKNIALLCGFHDAAYFSNVFRDSVGLSPSQFIQKKR